MKHSVRLLLIMLTLIIAATSLCGCDLLDEARQAHGILTKDGSILLNNATYYLLPTDANFYPPEMDVMIAITEPDVPVLLKDVLGTPAYMSQDEKFLYRTQCEDAYYCRSDVYEGLIDRMNTEFVPDGYYYEYYTFVEDEENFYGYKTNYYRLTDQQAGLINQVLQQVEPYELPSESSDDAEPYIMLMAATKDLYFREYFVDLIYWSNAYYLVEWEENASLSKYYLVPAEHEAAFDQIANAYVRAQQTYPEYDQDYIIA